MLRFKDCQNHMFSLKNKMLEIQKKIETYKFKETMENNKEKIKNLLYLVRQTRTSKSNLVIQTSNEITRLKFCFIICIYALSSYC